MKTDEGVEMERKAGDAKDVFLRWMRLSVFKSRGYFCFHHTPISAPRNKGRREAALVSSLGQVGFKTLLGHRGRFLAGSWIDIPQKLKIWRSSCHSQ